MKLAEAIPNLSTANLALFQGLQAQWQHRPNLWLLGLDADPDANRTVVTLVGELSALEEALWELFVLAKDSIDLRAHQGVHLRVGAVDVCPIVPLQGTTEADAQALVLRLAQRVWNELGMPLSLYQKSATTPERQALSFHRRGQYEGLAARLAQGHYVQDFGGSQFQPQTGLTVIGVRDFMLAYNVNLAGASLKQAKAIAERLRFQRDHGGQGKLPGVQIMGWFLEDRQLAQISCNLYQLDQCSLFDVYLEVQKAALPEKVRVSGSELVGLAPRKALLPNPPADKSQWRPLLEEAVASLGLDDLAPFDINERIIELKLQQLGGPDEI